MSLLPSASLRLVAPLLRAAAPRCAASCAARASRRHAASEAARPQRSPFLQRRGDAGQPADAQGGGQAKQDEPVRYGPLDVDLQPRDQLRPLLPTWNPPPTRPPAPEELEVSTRLRFCLEDRWWAATVREVADDKVKVGYDGWPSRHDEWVPRDSDRMYMHESFHEDYVAPPLPQRYQRHTPTDAEGNPVPVTPRPPRPRVYDPEKERLKRALRPPMPYNPEKERLKRVLRGQYAPPIEEHMPPLAEPSPEPAGAQAHAAAQPPPAAAAPAAAQAPWAGAAAARGAHAEPAPQAQEAQAPRAQAAAPQAAAEPAAATAAAPPPPAPPAPPATPVVEWIEVPGGVQGARAFRHAATGEVRSGKPPSGWVELLAGDGAPYYWHVDRQVTQWERPQA